MKIYTNEGNPFGFEVLLLTKFAKCSTSVETTNLNSKDFLTLPTIELDDGSKICSTAAIARYLFPNEGRTRDEWLEWATVKLAPALAHHMGQGHHADANATSVLNVLIKKLENRLSEAKFLAGDKLSAADIAVWSLLAPDGTLKGAQNIECLLKWYKHIQQLPEVQECLAQQPLKQLTFTALQQSNRYGGLYHIKLGTASAEDGGKLLAENSTSLADTVSEEEKCSAGAKFVPVSFPECTEPRTVLPKPGKRNVLITSALPYVNNVPHLGNIIGSVLSADIFARYSRLAGYNTLYICGTDEYGTATENKALAENLTPQQICDKYFEIHNSVYRWFGIGFDYFGRTTTKEQTEIVQEAFKDVYANGYILKESVEQLLCQKCDRFLADRFVEGTCPHPGCGYEDARGDQCDKCGKLVNATELIRPRCKVCNSSPVIRSSDQLFIDLPKIEPQLRTFLESSDQGWTNNARVIVQSWLREGLKPRCITRDLKWGVPVPLAGFEKKVFYVWFDAPFGYVSITKRYTKDYQQWWQPAKGINVEYFQFMAKDNVPFHGLMWPSVLLGMNKGHTLVSHIMATEYLNYEDGKFSKSRGIGVFGNDAVDTGIPADVWRFYLASARPEGQDSAFSWNDLMSRNNSELLNNLGNFVNRALVFCEKNFQSTVPQMVLKDEDLILLALINREIRGYIAALERAKLRDGIRHILSISRHGNGYMQSQQPWVLLKGTDEQKIRAGTVIGVCCNISALLANLIFPYMPSTARLMYAQLNIKQGQLKTDAAFVTQLLASGHKIGKPAPLFQKLEQSFVDELKKKYGGTQETNGNKKQAAASVGKNVADLEKAVLEQGEKVRQLKASTKDKTVWQPEVNILLDLKKQLAEAQKQVATAPPPSEKGVENVKELQNAVDKQADKVRQLKASTKDKSVWQPEVNILLDLKKKLAEAQQQSTAAPQTSNNHNSGSKHKNEAEVKNLQTAVDNQANKVRQLKASTKDKSIWQPEVNILLELKQKLAAALQNSA